MKIAVYGAGGVGAYFGARLAKADADVHLIARGAHLDALREGGLRVVSENGDIECRLPATADPAEVGPSDVVLFCVKATDTREAARTLSPLLADQTAVVSLQNGVDNESDLAEAIPAHHVVGGVAYIMATIAEPGVILHEGRLARWIFGERDGRRSERLSRLLELCRRAKIDAVLTTDIHTELWRKLAMICATGGMTAAVRLPVGDIRRSRAAFGVYRAIANEVLEVARREDARLDANEAETIAETARKLPAGSYSSLHYDLTHGKPMELDALHGAVIRRARRAGIAVPMCEAVYGILAPWAVRNRTQLLLD